MDGTAAGYTDQDWGTLEVRKRDDGRIELGQADPVLALSLGLLADGIGDGWLSITDGLVCVAGVGPDDQAREVRYRPVGFRPAPPHAPHVSEGGFLVLERVT